MHGIRMFVAATFALLAGSRAYGTQADSTATAIPAEHKATVLDVRSFGAAGDGGTLDTAAITKAIRAASAAGGGTVAFPPGVYATGTFELLSNVTLEVRAGAVIQGSKNLADYQSIASYGFGKSYGSTARARVTSSESSWRAMRTSGSSARA